MGSGNWHLRKKRSRDAPRPQRRRVTRSERAAQSNETLRASIFERPTVIPQTASEEQSAPAPPPRLAHRARRRATQASQRPTRPSPASMDSAPTAARNPSLPETHRSAQLQPRHVIGALRARAPAPQPELTAARPATATTDPEFPPPAGQPGIRTKQPRADGAGRAAMPPSLTLPSVEAQGSSAAALHFVDAQSRRSAPPPASAASDPGALAYTLPTDLHPSLSDLYALDDFSGALEEAERRLATDPRDAYASRIASDCRRVLTQMYLARIGRWDQHPRVVVDDEQLRWLSLDHHSGFLLSLVDGQFTLEELLDICGMPRLDALKLLAELTEKGVVAIE